MGHRNLGWGALIALGLLGCELDGARAPEPTPSPTPTFAPGTRWELVGTPDGQVEVVTFVNPDVAWGAGDSNTIQRSVDGGKTWAAPKALPSTWNKNVSQFVSVSFVDPRFGFVGGSYGVFKTEDGGDSWAPVPPFVQENPGPPAYDSFAHVRFRDYEHGVVVDGTQQLQRTEDGGKTWKAVPLAAAARQLGQIGSALAVLTDAGLLKEAPDGTWTTIALPTAFRAEGHTEAYSAFHFLDDQNGWVSGAGALWRTADGGKKWIRLQAEEGAGLAVRFADAARGWSLGKYAMYATRNGGATWDKVPDIWISSRTSDLRPDFQILDPTHVYAFGGDFGIRRLVGP
jgi:photosystem II stability/assembly factor-like uncharacterized protein